MKHLKWLIPVFIIAFCFLGFLIAPNDPEAMDIVNKYAAPSVDFPLGTDQFGRCELSRLLYGGKVTLGIVLLGGSIVLVLGTLIGLWLGRANAAKSLAFSSLLDAVTAIPPLAYLIIFVGIWGNSIPTMLVALTVSLILRMIKLVKTQTELELDSLCAVRRFLRGFPEPGAVCPYPAEHHPAAGAFSVPVLRGDDYEYLGVLLYWPDAGR